jgi:hypothetical protein
MPIPVIATTTENNIIFVVRDFGLFQCNKAKLWNLKACQVVGLILRDGDIHE